MQTITKIKKYSVIGAIFTTILGVLSHFIYDWSGNSKIVGVFGSVNESTWEHLKLLFWPVFAFAIIEYIAYGYKQDAFFMGKALSVLVGMITIISLFYTYTGIVGKHYLFVDILIFFIGVIAAYSFFSKFVKNYIDIKSNSLLIFGFIAFILLAVLFVSFTFNPPKINLFLDPVTKTYGIYF